jgi:hypothetical protein
MADLESIGSMRKARIDEIVLQLDEMATRNAENNAQNKRAAMEQIESVQKERPCSDYGEIDTLNVPYHRDPKKSIYYLSFVGEQEKPRNPFPKLFGLPQYSYLKLLLDLKRNGAFQLWYNKNHDPKKQPIELLLLGFLRALKISKTQCIKDMSEVDADVFYDVSFMTDIEPEMLHQFFHYFLFDGFTSVYYNYVQGRSFVVTASMLEHLNNFAKAGLFGINEAKMTKRLREVQKCPA